MPTHVCVQTKRGAFDRLRHGANGLLVLLEIAAHLELDGMKALTDSPASIRSHFLWGLLVNAPGQRYRLARFAAEQLIDGYAIFLANQIGQRHLERGAHVAVAEFAGHHTIDDREQSGHVERVLAKERGRNESARRM